MRFLVLTHLFGEFTGSEINALQLCVGLKNAGHQADIGSFELRGPLIDYANQCGIAVHDLIQDEGPPLHYDVIWAHHAPVLTHVLFRRKLSPSKVIFSSLSPLTPLESPPTYHAELPWILAHSPFNVAHLGELNVSAERIHYFPNFAPKEFFDVPRLAPPRGLKQIVIVSNHQTEEVLKMAELAREDGVHVEIIGRDKPLLVDASILPNYDLVITIGKTVQYAFAQKVPVYCYDHFGGLGYINAANFDTARYGNFSGRTPLKKLTGPEIYADIRAGYEEASALDALDFLQGKARALFSLEVNLARVLALLEDTPLTDINGLLMRHRPAGRLNDAYMVLLRHRLGLEATLRELTQLKPAPPLKRGWRKWLSRSGIVN